MLPPLHLRCRREGGEWTQCLLMVGFCQLIVRWMIVALHSFSEFDSDIHIIPAVVSLCAESNSNFSSGIVSSSLSFS